MKKYIGAILLFLLFSSTAFADCMNNGKAYPTGTILGPLVCSGNGTWVVR
jgi:hypothetical protein